MLSLADSICLCDGGADSANDGESGLDLLRDEDGNTYESSRYHTDDGATLHRFMAAMLTGKVVISSSESDMMTNRVNTLVRSVVAGKGVGRGVIIVM
ncbi:hypothetical protein Tco_1074247 [Tanacetum coccineum]